MDRRSALVLLAVFGAGVFLAGLELMITAVALPSILADLVDADGTSAWIELRKASWIINGYLLVYILTMPLAGRMADLWGARRPFLAALVDLHGRQRAGRHGPGPRPADRGPARPGGRRRRSSSRSGPRPRPTCSAATARPRALGRHRRADVPRAWPPARSLAPRSCRRSTRRRRSPAAGLAGTAVAGIAGPAWRWIFYVERPDRARRRWSSPGPPRRAGTRRVAPGRLDIVGAALFGVALAAGLIGLTLLGATSVAGTSLDPTDCVGRPRRRGARGDAA